MNEGLRIISPKIGHGNPFTALACGILTEGRVDVFYGVGPAILGFLHQAMTRVSRLSADYTKESEKLRRGIGGWVIGLLQLEGWLQEKRFTQFNGQSLADVGIFIQEHLLAVLPKKLLERWFPQGVFLYIPDVFPKKSAVDILRKHQDLITPLVWNRQAFEELITQGLTPILCKPVLPFGLLRGEKVINLNPEKRVFKSSGSGVDRKLLDLITQSRKPGEILQVWLPGKVVIYSNDSNSNNKRNKRSNKKEVAFNNLEDYARNFYSSLLDTGEIISYPSEMVQVIASLVGSGWRGRFLVLPPRGAHEKRNLEWLEKFFTPRIKGKLHIFDFSQVEEKKITNLLDSLGKESLVLVIEKNKRNLPGNLLVSSEALKLPFVPPPALKQELVIGSADELIRVNHWQEIAGIHFRTGRILPEDKFFEDLETIMIKAEERRIPYVTVHLEDLPSNAEETRRRLSQLNDLGAYYQVILLLENVTPRVDQPLEKWQYSLFEFVKEFGKDLDCWQNIGFCLDFDHLELAESEVFDILGKVFEAKLTRVDHLEKILTEEEKIFWHYFQAILRRIKTIHWSRAKGRNEKLFEVFENMALRSPEKLKKRIHQAYVLLENFLFAHYSLASDENFFGEIITMLQELGWSGNVVIESPDILEIIRERHRPHNQEIALMIRYTELMRKNQQKRLENFFKEKGLSDKDTGDLVNFVFADIEPWQISERFFGFLSEFFPLLRTLYQDEKGQDFRRKVNGGLYLRHVLRLAVLADVYFSQLKAQGLIEDSDYPRLIFSIFFHDAKEIKPIFFDEEQLRQRLKEQGFSEEFISQVITDISLLTPREKPKDFSYFQKKQQDFDLLIEEYQKGNRIPLIVKAFDILANMEETIDDLSNGREDGQMRPLAERFQVFAWRVDRLTELLGETSLIFRLQKFLNDLSSFLPGLPVFFEQISGAYHLRKDEEVILKYVVIGDGKKLIIAPAVCFTHQQMVSCDEGIFGGEIAVWRDGRLFVDFRGDASSIALDGEGRNFFQILRENIDPGNIECLQINPSNPVAGLSSFE